VSRTVKLSILDRVRIASPCPMEWGAMKGDERVRHCDMCHLDVHNLSAMTRAEAEEFMEWRASQDGRVCVGFYRRADGTILTQDCPVGLRALRLRAARMVTRAAAVLGLLVTGATMLGARTRTDETRLRGMEPFASIVKWLTPPPVATQTPVPVQGQFCPGDVGLIPQTSVGSPAAAGGS
jgi:hypothetical protein